MYINLRLEVLLISIFLSTTIINTTTEIKENDLPMFRDLNSNKEVFQDGSFPQNLNDKFGYETTFCTLPYKMQDRYSRLLESKSLKTVVLENENLRAEFLVEFGGRLSSLFDKKNNKELLFKNNVLQIANLAIRDAWFSGGIEWNIGRFGHTNLTCEPMFFALCKDDFGNDFLRMYEYERSRCVFLQIDFHLPKGATELAAHVRLINDTKRSIPMYWWTNTAIPETKKMRIFSSADNVIYIKPSGANYFNNFGYAKMPFLPFMGDIDASYPLNSFYSNEYFFQTPDSENAPWEAACYEDNSMFFERSTKALQFRKMFCWGNHKGGQKWKDFLSTKDNGNYVEIQAGITPSQLHGMDMAPQTTISFTQVFGGTKVDYYEGDWFSNRDHIKAKIDEKVSEKSLLSLNENLEKYADLPIYKILSNGSGWGALEQKRREKQGEMLIPSQLVFPENSLGKKQMPWLSLLEHGTMPDTNETPKSWIVDLNWKTFLEKGETENVCKLTHLGVMLYENRQFEQAKATWEKAISIRKTAILYRNLSYAAMQLDNDLNKSLDLMKTAVLLSNNKIEYLIEYMTLLEKAEKYTEIFELFKANEIEHGQNEKLLILATTSAYKLGNFEFAKRIFSFDVAGIREANNVLTDMWFNIYGKDSIPPENIDFRMFSQ